MFVTIFSFGAEMGQPGCQGTSAFCETWQA
jgi:hypothetical protein